MKSEDTLEDLLTQLDPPYESTEERHIGRTLDSYAIPFFYKQPVILYDGSSHQLAYPTFSIPTYGGAVVDYMAEPYGETYEYKDDMYRQNQIPSVLMTAQTLQGKTWQEQLYNRLQQIYQQSQTYQRNMYG